MAATDKAWLADLSRAVAQRLRTLDNIPSDMLVAPGEVRTQPSDTDGWYADVARLPSGRGDRLQIWCDNYTLAKGRRLYLCYKTPRPLRARLLAEAGIESVRKVRWVEDSFYTQVGLGEWRMVKPLPAADFRVPFGELYERRGSWSFVGIYLPQRINPRRPASPATVHEIAEFFARLLRSIMVVHIDAEADKPYREADRKKVKRHLQRERAAALARLAKIRDQFTCQVCRVNFQQLYGSLGAGFAEAHHRIPLSSPRAATETFVKDLVTVCANCHRMLHRLSPHVDGVEALKKRFTRWWPRPSAAG